jgi:hypothetical protein
MPKNKSTSPTCRFILDFTEEMTPQTNEKGESIKPLYNLTHIIYCDDPALFKINELWYCGKHQAEMDAGVNGIRINNIWHSYSLLK